MADLRGERKQLTTGPIEELIALLRDQRVSHACTLLLLVEYPGEAVTLAEVDTWTDGQLVDVIRWASAVHLGASDNYPWTSGGHVPPMPTVLSER